MRGSGEMTEERRSVTIHNPIPIERKVGGGVMAFLVSVAESFRWYSGDQFTLLMSGREVPVPQQWVGVGTGVGPPDPVWNLHAVKLTEETAGLTDGDRLIVTFKDPRHKTGDIEGAKHAARVAADALGRADEAAALREKHSIEGKHKPQ
jgi:hypothetical protein